ncbi:hypothetical protein IEQ34_021733 [Dendrobium chrysotoxum]|uniref:Uncharacterized protein n=1 Tax=Dendrobium chrysotoxum TaxID=161865 RepID=A0AAV7G4B5_DENCH|nr:hypothetical protein IEQ34_021733 [Dendrobium chrysotoxum]
MAAQLMRPSTMSFGRLDLNSKSMFCFSTSGPSSTRCQELGLRKSQFAGLKLSISLPPSFNPTTPVNKIFAKRICPFTGKKANKANKKLQIIIKQKFRIRKKVHASGEFDEK